MDARLRVAALICLLPALVGAGYRTKNFVVQADSADVAEQVGRAAEQYRADLAELWLGETMPDWTQPCPLRVEVGPRLGAGGVTTFYFERGEVFGWDMEIQGSLERVLDSVLPHEVTHTVFASHFRRPLPRWADEGACSTVEHPEERARHGEMLVQFLQTRRGLPFHRMFALTEYPRDVMPLYAQGHSLATFLIEQGGRRKFLEFLGDGMERERWSDAVRGHYGYRNLRELQDAWLEWVRQGSPLPLIAADTIAAADGAPAESDVTYRGQSPTEEPTPLAAAGQLVAVPARRAPPAAAGPAAVGDPFLAAQQAREASAEEPAGQPLPPASAEEYPGATDLAQAAAPLPGPSGGRAGVPLLEWRRDAAVQPAAAQAPVVAQAPATDRVPVAATARAPGRSVYDRRARTLR